MIQVRDAAMTLELGARKAACLGPGRRVADVSCAAQDRAIQREDARTLKELYDGETDTLAYTIGSWILDCELLTCSRLRVGLSRLLGGGGGGVLVAYLRRAVAGHS